MIRVRDEVEDVAVMAEEGLGVEDPQVMALWLMNMMMEIGTVIGVVMEEEGVEGGVVVISVDVEEEDTMDLNLIYNKMEDTTKTCYQLKAVGVDVEGVDIVEGAVVSGLMEDRSKPLHEVLKG